MITGYELHGPFALDDWQRAKLAKWLRRHDKTCALAHNSGAIGGRLSVTFSPTSLGPFTQVDCACGSKVDLTDYDAL